ncbi:MAG: class I SAM-dependent methyltransferase [Phycisphaerae bacterium]
MSHKTLMPHDEQTSDQPTLIPFPSMDSDQPLDSSSIVADEQVVYDMDWDGYSRKIAERKESDGWAVLREARESHYRELFRIKPGDRVLDAGCGHGEYCAYAAESGARVSAFDYSDEMVDYTRALMRSRNLPVDTLETGSVLDIDYPDNHFDSVICLSVLDHIADRERGFAELSRVLKPGGHLYIDVPNRYAYHWRTCFAVMRLLDMYPAGKIHFFSPQELTRMLKAAGCQPEAHLGLTFCPPFSGLYTTDLRRITCLPRWMIGPLDKLYLALEKTARRYPPTRWFCWHNFVRAVKTES